MGADLGTIVPNCQGGVSSQHHPVFAHTPTLGHQRRAIAASEQVMRSQIARQIHLKIEIRRFGQMASQPLRMACKLMRRCCRPDGIF